MNKYNEIAYDYDVILQDPRIAREIKEVKSLLEPLIGKQTILDIGCGTGLFLDLFPQTNPEKYIGVDPSFRMLERMLKKHPHFLDRVICSKFEQILVKKPELRISLFGSLNYIEPTKVLFLSPADCFFMFYKEDKTPLIHKKAGVKIKHFSYPKSKLKQFYKSVIETDNYYLVSNLSL